MAACSLTCAYCRGLSAHSWSSLTSAGSMNGTKVREDGERQHQAPVRPALAAGRSDMGGRHEGPEPRTDLFMAVIVFALIALLASVIIPALQ